MNSSSFQIPMPFCRQWPAALAALAVLALVVGFRLTPALAAEPTRSSASPFGLELGQATCALAATQFGPVKEEKLEGGDVLVKAASPEKIYPGASKVLARCRVNRVIAVQVELSKGGLGSEASREAFATLKSKYKLVAGGPMPSLGDGYARFVAGTSVIEQNAPHLSFEFTISWFEKSFYDQLMSNSTKEKQETASRKKSSL
jgi:hypothetical protein